MKVKLTLRETDALLVEIKSLLTADVPFLAKYEMREIQRVALPLVESMLKTRDEIITQFGVATEGGFTLQDSEKSDEGVKAIIELLDKEKTITSDGFEKSAFEKVSNEYPYEVIFKFIKQ